MSSSLRARVFGTRKTRRLTARFTLLLLLIACSDPVSPLKPHGAVRFTPPTDYTRYWQQMQDCSHLSGDMSRIAWFDVPGASFNCPTYGSCDGLWVRPHTIYIADQRRNDSLVVEHEMLHDLLQSGFHRAAFQTCGVP